MRHALRAHSIASAARPIFAAWLACAFAASGCQAHLGPQAIRRAAPAFNDVIVREMNEQLLLNLVRLRYRDNPLFLEVGTITATQTLSSSGGVAADFSVGAGAPTGYVVRPSLGLTYSESPTVVFTPLQGEGFFRRMMSPLPPIAVMLFAASGWSIARVMALAIDRVNEPSAAGPTPADAPQFEDFHELAATLRELQIKHAVAIGVDQNGSSSELVVEFSSDPKLMPQLELVRRLLHLTPGLTRYTFTGNVLGRDETHVAVRMRSLLSVLFYLSQGVEVPESDGVRGLVTVTHSADGKPFDWQAMFKGWFRVRASETEPGHAYVRVHHRGHWFYIADDDLETKSTFMLLTELFNLQAGQAATPPPQLTLPLR
jgi:hypothetical protein